MKIALVSPYDFAYPGGVVNHISSLQRELTRLGHDVKIIAPTSKKDHAFGDRFIHIGTPRSIPSSGAIARITVSVRLDAQIREVFAREKFDICHLHEPLMPTVCTSTLRLKLAPMVGTFHAAGAKPWYIMFSPLAKWYLDRWFNKLDGRIAVSRPARDYISRFFPADYTIIPNGIDTHHFNSHSIPFEQYCDGKLNILFVGRFEKRKGFDYLLKAYRQVKSSLPESRLIAVGPGVRLRNKYEKHIRRHGVEDVIFPGYVAYSELPRYYTTADIVCFPTTGRESFGIVLLEAMSAGRPVVASDIAGYNSVLTDGEEGTAVPPRDVDRLAGAIFKLAGDERLRRQMGARGVTRARQYDWSVVAKRVLDFYTETLARVNKPTTRPAADTPKVRTASGIF
jgi:phosphatidyl-myo-inositol alpha-mannosyltransferase